MNEFCLRVDILSFNEDLDIMEFFVWVAKCNRLEKHMTISNERMMKLVSYKLKSGASYW